MYNLFWNEKSVQKVHTVPETLRSISSFVHSFIFLSCKLFNCQEMYSVPHIESHLSTLHTSGRSDTAVSTVDSAVYPGSCYLHTIILHKTVTVSVIKAITVLCDVTVHKIPPGHFFTRNGELSNCFFLWCARVFMSWCVVSVIKAITVLCDVTVHKTTWCRVLMSSSETSMIHLLSGCSTYILALLPVTSPHSIMGSTPRIFTSLCPGWKQAGFNFSLLKFNPLETFSFSHENRLEEIQ